MSQYPRMGILGGILEYVRRFEGGLATSYKDFSSSEFSSLIVFSKFCIVSFYYYIVSCKSFIEIY